MVLALAAASLLSLSAHAAGEVSQAKTGGFMPTLSMPGGINGANTGPSRQLSFTDLTKGLSIDKLLPGIPGLPVTSQIMNLVGPKLEPAPIQETTAKAPQVSGLPSGKIAQASAAPARAFNGKFTPAPLAQGKNQVLGAQKQSQNLTAATQLAADQALGNLKETPAHNGEGSSVAGGKFWDNMAPTGGTVKRVEDYNQGGGRTRSAGSAENSKGNSFGSQGGPSYSASEPRETPASMGSGSAVGGAAAAVSDSSEIGLSGRQADEPPSFGRTPEFPIPGGELENKPSQAPPVALIALKLVGNGFVLSDSNQSFSLGENAGGSGGYAAVTTPNGTAGQDGSNAQANAFQTVEMQGLRDAVSATPGHSAVYLEPGVADVLSYVSPATLLARSGAASRAAALRSKASPRPVPSGSRSQKPLEPSWFLLLPLAVLVARYRTEFL